MLWKFYMLYSAILLYFFRNFDIKTHVCLFFPLSSRKSRPVLKNSFVPLSQKVSKLQVKSHCLIYFDAFSSAFSIGETAAFYHVPIISYSKSTRGHLSLKEILVECLKWKLKREIWNMESSVFKSSTWNRFSIWIQVSNWTLPTDLNKRYCFQCIFSFRLSWIRFSFQ